MSKFVVTIVAKVLMHTYVDMEADTALEAKIKAEKLVRWNTEDYDWEMIGGNKSLIDVIGAPLVTDENGVVIDSIDDYKE